VLQSLRPPDEPNHTRIGPAEPVTATTPYEALPEQLTVEEYITFTRISRATAYDHVRRGILPSIRYGRLLRIPKSVLR
jgi:excisionase family DNA binding protein